MSFAVRIASSVLCLAAPLLAEETCSISLDEYRDKVYAAWLGQCVGNMYGFDHEFKYEKEPRLQPIAGWEPKTLDRIRQVDAAFSDDDTDIEYVDLLCMEHYGPEPTYEQLAGYWRRCINERIWYGNRAARNLMELRYLPPMTGRVGLNPHYAKIDPQLTCEIWAMTAPGMIDYAAAKAQWAAQVVADDYGTHPTIWYNTMYAAAFFEHDVETLCQIGYEQLPADSIFREAIDDVRRWRKEHGDDWVAVRQKIKAKYYDRQGLTTKIDTGGVSAILNGTLGVLALLYGSGDFDKTLDLAIRAGYDADNQAATLAGLIAIIHGSDVINRKYTHILDHWDKPLNDLYRNITRDDLPDAKLTDIARRTSAVGIQLVCANGGRVEGDQLIINRDAPFIQPLEVRLSPVHVRADAPTTIATEIIGGRAGRPARVMIREADIPGLSIKRLGDSPRLEGTPTQPGEYPVTLTVTNGMEQRTTTLSIIVRGPNLGRRAQRVISPIERPSDEQRFALNALRDGVRTYWYTARPADDSSGEVFLGYLWKTPQTLSRVIYHAGPTTAAGGAFRAVRVEYLTADQKWIAVEGEQAAPPANTDTLQNGDALITFTFSPIEAYGIRVIGPAKNPQAGVTIRELIVPPTENPKQN